MKTEKENNDAVDVLNGTVENLRALAALVEHWDELSEYAFLCTADDLSRLDADEREELAGMREELVDALGSAALLGAVLSLRDELKAEDAGEVVGLWLDGVLDVSIRGAFRGDRWGWEADEVEVMLTAGGPSVWVTYDGRPELLVSVAWWGPTNTRRVDCAPLSDYLAELCDAHSEAVAR